MNEPIVDGINHEENAYFEAVEAVVPPHKTEDIRAVVNLKRDEEIVEFARKHNLSAQQEELLGIWLKEGVQSNTSAWFQVTKAYFSDVDPRSQDKYLATLLFMDAMNRADEIFDTRRELFVDGDQSRINSDTVESLPVVKIDENRQGTVRELRQIVLKIIESSEEYSKEELDHIRWQIEHFLDISTEYQREYEDRESYTFDEALALRFGTVGPLVDTFANIFAYSADTVSSGDREQVANRAIAGFRKAVMAWQLSDDLNDLASDLKNKNTNLVAGLLRDEDEMRNVSIEDFMDYDTFVYDCPKTTERMATIYADWTAQLKPHMKSVLDARVPYFFTHDLDDGEEDWQDDAA